MIKNNLQKIELNVEICEFIGAFIGDGYLGNYGPTKSQYVIGITGDKKLDKEYLYKHLVSIVKRNFQVNPRIYLRNDENTLMLRINSKELYSFFRSLGFKNGPKSSFVTIPSVVAANNAFMNAAIRGIFDTDGCVFLDARKLYKRPYPRISLQSASLPLINQLEEYLSLYFQLYVNKSNRDGYRNYIEIYGHKQVETFLKTIGFSNERHLSKLPP